jgi:hypothetical protein
VVTSDGAGNYTFQINATNLESLVGPTGLIGGFGEYMFGANATNIGGEANLYFALKSFQLSVLLP